MEAVIVAYTHVKFYYVSSCALLRVPVMYCAHVFTESVYICTGVLALSVLRVTVEGESTKMHIYLYLEGNTVNIVTVTARLSKSSNFP